MEDLSANQKGIEGQEDEQSQRRIEDPEQLDETWCKRCDKKLLRKRTSDGPLACDLCGNTVENLNSSTQLNNAAPQIQGSGSIVTSVQSGDSNSCETRIGIARNYFVNLRDSLGFADDGDVVIDTAAQYFTMAFEKSFTQGRRTELVQAACLYSTCREKNLPFLLIDFSNLLQVSIYELGSVYLQLCEILNISGCQNYEKILDPSVFIPSFSNCLLQGTNDEAVRKTVLKTARDIIAGQDWMQTGQKLSDICGEALYGAALSHNTVCLKTNIENIVKSCEASVLYFSPGRNEFNNLRDALGIADEGGDVIDTAAKFFTMAVAQNFTKHCRTELVKASCLYLTCREKNLPFLLIDFSSYLRVSIYELGSVYLQLCKILNVAGHQTYEHILDPSVFIPSFSNRLFKGGTHDGAVVRTARDIIASMKRDWIQTGQRSNKICGAALYTAALSHGIKCSKPETVDVVHQYEAAVNKRLIQFEDTESSNVDELTEREREFLTMKLKSNEDGVVCMHQQCKPFGYALCQSCYNDFIILTSGIMKPLPVWSLEEGIDSFNEEEFDLLFQGPETSQLLTDPRNKSAEICFLLGESVKRAKEASVLIEALKQTHLEDAQKEIQVAITSLGNASIMVHQPVESSSETQQTHLEDAQKEIQVAITSLGNESIMVDKPVESSSETQKIERNLHSDKYGRVYTRRRKMPEAAQQ